MASLPVFSTEVIASEVVLAKEFNKRYVQRALAAVNRIAERTPVDTGFAQAGWVLSLNTPDGESLPIDAGGFFAPFNNELRVAKAKIGDVIFVNNNVPYIIYLENGSPTTVATRMVARTFAELNLKPL